MPQLDLYSILNQFFWGFFFFVTFYCFITFFFIPSLFTSMYARKVFIDSRASEVSLTVASIFLTHAVVLIHFDRTVHGFQHLIDYTIYPKIVYSSTYSTSFDAEFEKGFIIDEELKILKNMKKSILTTLYSSLTFRATWLSCVTYLTYGLHEFYRICLYAAKILYSFIHLFIRYLYILTFWAFEIFSWIVNWFSPVDVEPFGNKSDVDMCSDLTTDLLNIATLVHSTFVAAITRLFWFLSFMLPFSILVSASATNEYLLFCCIVLTIFFSYDKFTALVVSNLTPNLQTLHILVTNKLSIISEISLYQEEMIRSYDQVASLLEELFVLICPLAVETQAADFSLFDESLAESLRASLRDQLLEEYTLEFYLELLEELEFGAEALNDFLEDLDEKLFYSALEKCWKFIIFLSILLLGSFLPLFCFSGLGN